MSREGNFSQYEKAGLNVLKIRFGQCNTASNSLCATFDVHLGALVLGSGVVISVAMLIGLVGTLIGQ